MITVRNIALASFAALLLVACADDNRRVEDSSGYQTEQNQSTDYQTPPRSEPVFRDSQSK